MAEIFGEQMIYFCSDPHYGHKNLCFGTSSWPDKERSCRKFNTIDEMNDDVVTRINNLVKEGDTLYCLGDWSFGGTKNAKVFRERLNCQDIRLILGNHDNRHGETVNPRIDENTCFYDLFTSVDNYLEFRYNGTKFCLFHYPIHSWNEMSKGSIHLFGHVHSAPEDRFFNGGKSMDVGFDGGGPYSIESILDLMKNKSKKTEGHHA